MNDTPEYDYDFIVIGSGFGGSTSALRLAEKGYTVGVMEMGKRFGPEDFPKNNMQLSKFFWFPKFLMYGMQQFTLLRHAYIAHGCGVGGGSLIYANTLPIPPSHVFKDGRWPDDDDWEAKLSPFYKLAHYMLGAVPAKQVQETDDALREVVDDDINEGASTFRRHTVSVFYGDKAGETVPDPYFGGEGVDRTGCIHCAECMVGCKHNSKNTLDKNYLHLAENRGVEVHPETRVVDIVPHDGGYDILTEQSTRAVNKPQRRFRAKKVIVAASVLGTINLLMRCKERGSLPHLSDQLGNYVRTNAEAFGAITTPKGTTTHAKGIAITSGVNLPDGTHIEAVRWGPENDFLGMQTTLYVDGESRLPRPLRWLTNGIRHPFRLLKASMWKGWAETTTLFMAMKPSDSYLRLKIKWGPFGRRLDSTLSDGEKPEVYMPGFNVALNKLAKKLNGTITAGFVETVLGISTTAHILGGATMGQSPEDGVCDSKGRVFGYEGLYVCDGSLVPANLTVNPSLTITALTEYVMSNIPPKDGAEQNYIDIPEEYARAYRPSLETEPALIAK